MRTPAKFISLILMLLTAGPAAREALAQTSYSITVKAGGLRQSFEGFGASQSGDWASFDPTRRAQMADLVYSDLKMNTLRLWVSCDETQTVATMLTEFNARYIASGAIAEIKNCGVSTLLLAPTRPAPVYSWTTQPVETMSAYATRLAEFILQLKTTYNVQIDITGIANEPGSWSNANMVDCAKYLRSALDARELGNVKIIAPEQPSAVQSISFIDALRGDSTAWSNIYGIASHSYGSVLKNADMEDRKDSKPWWVTEASDDGNEYAEDENRACSILARFLCEVNHGANEWIFFIGLCEKDNISVPCGTTAFLAVYDRATSSLVAFLKYYYFKQALNTFDRGAIFRKCVSVSEGEMFLTYNGTANQNPAINAAAAYNPDGSWGIGIVNDTGVTGSPATSTNLFYPATSYNVTLTVEELANTPSMNFTVYRSRANNHFVTSGTVALVNGVATLTIAPKELVSLRSAPTAAAVPPAPDGLKASTINAPVALSWNNTVKATSWRVKRATASGGPYTTIATTSTTSYDDDAASEGTVYYYVISAVNAVGEGANSAEVVASPTPFPWWNGDVGAVGLTGRCPVSDDGTFTTYGAGSGIAGTSDAFNFTYQTMTGDGTVTARLVSANLANAPSASIGILMRETLDPASKRSFLYYDYNVGWKCVRMTSRTVFGGGSSWAASAFTTTPVWLKLVRSGSLITGYASGDGTSWTAVTSSTVPMNPTIYVGLADSSRNTAQLCPAILDNVTVPCPAPTGLTETGSAGQIKLGWTAALGAASYNVRRATVSGGPYTTLGSVSSPALNYTDTTAASGPNYFYAVSAINPAGESANSGEFKAWLNADIGTAGLAGRFVISASGVATTNGAGSGIGGTADSFNFSYQMMTGDGTIIARLVSADLKNAGMAKIGIMMRDTLEAGSKEAFVHHDYHYAFACARMNARVTAGSNPSWWTNSAITEVPVWLKLVRSGSTFTGYASLDGTTWTMLASSTISMGTTIYVGLADTSINTAQLCPAIFDNITPAEGSQP